MSACQIPVFISIVVLLSLSRGQNFSLKRDCFGCRGVRTELSFPFCVMAE